MNVYRAAIYSLITSVAFVSISLGQASPPSEASTSNRADPAAVSSPHHTQAPSAPHEQTDKSEAKQTMKACIIREQADHTGMSMADAKKSCKEQLKVTPSK
jgi:hypothetical protein